MKGSVPHFNYFRLGCLFTYNSASPLSAHWRGCGRRPGVTAPSPLVHGKTNTALLLFVVIVLGLPSITKPISLQAAGRDLFAYHSVKEEEASEGAQSSSIYILLINNARRKGKLLISILETLSPKLGLAQGFSNCHSS